MRHEVWQLDLRWVPGNYHLKFEFVPRQLQDPVQGLDQLSLCQSLPSTSACSKSWPSIHPYSLGRGVTILQTLLLLVVASKSAQASIVKRPYASDHPPLRVSCWIDNSFGICDSVDRKRPVQYRLRRRRRRHSSSFSSTARAHARSHSVFIFLPLVPSLLPSLLAFC